MLLENDAARPHQSCEQDGQTEPPSRIEVKQQGKRHQCACHPTDGCRVGRYLPPDVDERADNLDGECSDEDTAD